MRNVIGGLLDVAAGMLIGGVIATLSVVGVANAADLAGPSLVASAFQAVGHALAPTVDYLVEAAIAAAIGWVALRLNKLTGIQIDAKHREALQSALSTGAHMILAQAASAGERQIAVGIDHVMAGAKDAVTHFGLSQERVRAMVIAKVQEAEPPPKALDAAARLEVREIVAEAQSRPAPGESG